MPNTPLPDQDRFPDMVPFVQLRELLQLDGRTLRRLVKAHKILAPDIDLGYVCKWWRKDRLLAWLDQQQQATAQAKEVLHAAS